MIFVTPGDVRRMDGGDAGRGGRDRSRSAAAARGEHLRLFVFRNIHRVRRFFHLEFIHRCDYR